jgi:tRNA G37 N-methylase Trm5
MGLTFCLAYNLDEAAISKDVADIEDTLLELIRKKYRNIFSPYIELLLEFDPYGKKVLNRQEIVQIHEMSKFLIDKLSEKETSEYFKKEFINVSYLEFADLKDFGNELYKVSKKAIDEEKVIIVIGD